MSTQILTNPDFTTYFGTPLIGFYIQWSTDTPNAFDLASSKLIMDVTWNLYSVGASTDDDAML